MTGPWAERPVESFSSSHRDHALSVAVECVPYGRRPLRSVRGDLLDYPTLPVAHHIAHTRSQRPVITAGQRRIPYKRPVISTHSSTTFCTARFRAPVRGHQGFLILGGSTPPVVEGVGHHDGYRACGLGGLQGAHHLRGYQACLVHDHDSIGVPAQHLPLQPPAPHQPYRSRTPATSAPIRLPLPFHHVSRFASQNQPENGFSGVLPRTPSRLERGCSAGAGWGNDNADPGSRRGCSSNTVSEAAGSDMLGPLALAIILLTYSELFTVYSRSDPPDTRNRFTDRKRPGARFSSWVRAFRAERPRLDGRPEFDPETGNRLDQIPGVGLLRSCEDLVGGTGLDDLPLLHHHDVVGGLPDDR